MEKRSGVEREPRDPKLDYFPTLDQLLSRVAASSNALDERVRRVDIRSDASGNVVYRYWVGRDEEHGVGSDPAP